MYLKFILAPYPSTFYGKDLVSYLMSTNIYYKSHQTMLCFLFLNNLTESNQRESKIPDLPKDHIGLILLNYYVTVIKSCSNLEH